MFSPLGVHWANVLLCFCYAFSALCLDIKVFKVPSKPSFHVIKTIFKGNYKCSNKVSLDPRCKNEKSERKRQLYFYDFEGSQTNYFTSSKKLIERRNICEKNLLAHFTNSISQEWTFILLFMRTDTLLEFLVSRTKILLTFQCISTQELPMCFIRQWFPNF